MAAACAAALVLRLFQLDAQSLWVDEVFTWHNVVAGGPITLREVFSNDHGPLHQVLLHFLTRVAGDGEAVMRLPSVLATAALAPALAWLAGRLLGPRAVVPAAWAAALSPFLVWYGQEARNYAFAMLFSALAAAAAVRWRAEGGRANGAWFVLSAWCGLLSNLNVAFIVPVLLGYLALPHGGTRGRPGAAVAATAALAVLMAPWALEYVERFAWQRLVPGRAPLPGEVPLRGPTTFSWGAFPFAFSSFSVGYTLGPPLRALHGEAPARAALAYWPLLVPAAVLFGGLAVRGIAALAPRPARLAFVLGLVALPIAAVTYFSLQNFKVFNPRYVASGLPGYYVLLVAGWLALGPRLRAATAAGVLVLWGISLSNWYFDPAHGKEDFRGATRWLAERVRPEDQLIGTGNFSPLDYYWRDRGPRYDRYWLGYAQQPGRMEAMFEKLEEPERTRWVTVSRTYLHDPAGRFERYLRERRGAAVERFTGVNVYRLPPGDGAGAGARGGRAGRVGGGTGQAAALARREPWG